MSDDDTYPMPPVMMGHTTEGSLHFQLDINDIIQEVEHNIKCEVYDGDNWKRPENIKPLLNQKGVNSVITTLRLRLSKIFVLSDFDEQDIYDMTRTVWNDIVDDFYLNWDEYGIRDTSAASYILHMVADSIYSTLRKGYRRNYLKFLSTTTNVQEMQHRAIQERPQTHETQAADPIKFLFGRKRR